MKKIKIVLTILLTILSIGGFIYIESHLLLLLVSIILSCIVLLLGLVILSSYYISDLVIEKFKEKYGK